MKKKYKFINQIKWIWFYHIYLPFKVLFHLNIYEKDKDKVIELATKVGRARFKNMHDGTWKFDPYGKD